MESAEPSAGVLLSRLEQQVLDQYRLTARNLDEIAAVVQRVSAVQPQLLAELRPLEHKLGLILTLFKASVWALLRQRDQQMLSLDEDS
ncbi:hypothetical protein JCM8115_002874 [Rhodotorula mucilaginosa]|uniref:DASH complex subunit DAD3 n=1 Tax=Rhodotorula mucilaginosa TaxID=5537 RepID=A0A9P6VVT3_RHOMI|nr:hypothetical protein C6P46_006660 [Rhodotorula mucilaginosa]